VKRSTKKLESVYLEIFQNPNLQTTLQAVDKAQIYRDPTPRVVEEKVTNREQLMMMVLKQDRSSMLTMRVFPSQVDRFRIMV
jgi:phosphopantetheine adenylyltransferase